MSNIPARDGNNALVDLATHLIGSEHHGAFLPSDPGTGEPFKAADDATLGNILQALAPLMSARGVDGSLRIQSQGGTITTITTVGTVTTVTTVTTVGNVANQTAIGGLQAAPQIPSLMNLAAASNIDRMVG